MCGSVFTHQSGPVDAESYREFLQGHIVDDLVVSALQKSGINNAERLQPADGQPGREGDGMLFGNANIENTFRHQMFHTGQKGACGHGRCNSHNFIILPGNLNDRFTKDFLVGCEFGVRVDEFSRFAVEAAGGMKARLLLFGLLKTFAFGGDDVQQFRAVNLTYIFQYVDQFLHVVAVHRAEIFKVHGFEQIAAFLQLPAVQGSRAFVDGNAVVIQNNQDIRVGGSRVVKSFKSHASRDGAVADHRNVMTVIFPFQP